MFKKIDSSLITTAVSLLVITGGFLINYLSNILPADALWKAFAIVSFISISSFSIGALYLFPRINGALNTQQSSITESLKDTITQFEKRISAFERQLEVVKALEDPDWVISTVDLIERELRIPRAEVWIVSSHLGAELNDDLFAPVILSNTNRGIIYYYVIPDDIHSIARVDAIRQMVTNKNNVKTIIIKNQELFNLISAHDTCVYDPFGRSPGANIGYMNMTCPSNGKEYFVQLGSTYCQRLVATVKTLGGTSEKKDTRTKNASK